MKNEKFSISQMQSNTPLLLLLLLLASFPLQPASFLLPSTQINIHNTWPAACYKHPLTGKRFRIALCNMYIHFIAKKEAEEETTTGEDTGQLRLKCKSQTRLSRLLITSFWKWGSPHGEVVQQIQSFLYVLGSFCEEKMLKKKNLPCGFERSQWLLPRCQWVWHEKQRCCRRGSVYRWTARNTGSPSAPTSRRNSPPARLVPDHANPT